MLRSAFILIVGFLCDPLFAADGSLTLKIEDEETSQSLIARTEFFRGAGHPAARQGRNAKQMPIRQVVPAGIGVVVDRQTVLELPDGPYRFRIVRGPEYRIVSGTFELEKTSLDEKTVRLPRMANLMEEGWLSGDCCVAPSQYSVPLRMASEDLHVVAVLGDRPSKPIPHRDSDEPIGFDPKWIRTDARHDNGLVFYGESSIAENDDVKNPFNRLVNATTRSASEAGQSEVKVAIENPFAWQVPVWLASGRVDGVFLLGDWLRLDKRVMRPKEARPDELFGMSDPTAAGRVAETVFRHCLNVGLRLAPLAGGGDQSSQTPLGYNRVYASVPDSNGDENAMERQRLPDSPSQWWDSVWNSHSVVTNGPLLRPLLGGTLPGYDFIGRSGEKLKLQPELNLAVRDPVDYLEVIHNDKIHYSARLDEFAKASGKIPPIFAEESGWVIIRVLTLHEEHYRAAVSAPWWITFDDQPRVSRQSVDYFQRWLADYEARLKKLPPNELAGYVPYVKAARRFWAAKMTAANSN